MRANVHEYDLVAPSSLETVLRLLCEEPGRYTPIAGGTEVMVALSAGRLSSRRLVSLSGLRELRCIHATSEVVTIGAAATFTDLRLHAGVCAKFPLLAEAAAWVGGIANQNRGTLGGNLVNASPAADSSPALLVYDATLHLISMSGMRTLPYREFHLGYKKTALRQDELIYSISLRPPAAEPRPIGYIRKVGTRNAMAISKTVLAGLLWAEQGSIREVRLAAASLAPTPIRLYGTERALTSQTLTPAALSAAAAALQKEVAPIDDIRSTAQYRRSVAGNLLEEFLRLCACSIAS